MSIFVKHPPAVADPAETERRTPQKTRGTVFNCLVLAALGAGIGMFSLLSGSASSGIGTFFSYFASPLVLLLNILPPVLLALLVYFLSGRAWLGFLITGLPAIALATVNYYKLIIRGDPLLFKDLSLIGETGTMLQSYTLPIGWPLIIPALFLVGGVIFTVKLMKGACERGTLRVIGAAASTVVLTALYLTVYTSGTVFAAAGPSGGPVPFSEGYIARGFIYPFIHSAGLTSEPPPEGYSEDEFELALLTGINDGGIPEDKKVNIISVMLESYADLSTLGALDFTIDVYAPFHRLQRESVSGTLINNVFAGGTIDTERLFLTGYTRLENFTGPVNSFVHYLRSQGYAAEGLHVGNNWFYDRKTVNSWLGFEEYYFLEDFEDAMRTDAYFFPKVLSMYRRRDKEKPYFSYSLSYQNHGAYPDSYTEAPHYISAEGLSDEAFNTLNNYLAGIRDTTVRLDTFIGDLRRESDPVVVVVFGDHMPLLGNREAVYRELGVNVDASTSEGFYNLYSTPYLIWANDAAKEALGDNFTGDGGSFSPCFLMSAVFDACSWEGDEYMRLLRDLRSYTDVINAPTAYFRENDILTYTLSEQAAAGWAEFRKVEYYRLHNYIYDEVEYAEYAD